MISPNGVPTMTPQRALQLVVIRGILTNVLTIEDGVQKLGMPRHEIERLVAGARRAVIAQLGEKALAV
jgi:hypothetical protein